MSAQEKPRPPIGLAYSQTYQGRLESWHDEAAGVLAKVAALATYAETAENEGRLSPESWTNLASRIVTDIRLEVDRFEREYGPLFDSIEGE